MYISHTTLADIETLLFWGKSARSPSSHLSLLPF
jgi:hypothetical protein